VNSHQQPKGRIAILPFGNPIAKGRREAACLEKIASYSKNTKICVDHDLGCDLDGFALAQKLHALGYKKLYMFSGRDFEACDVPDYLTVLSKIDIDKIKNLF